MPNELPDSVLALVENKPIEDLLLAILRRGLPDTPAYSLIPEDPEPHFVTARKVPGFGNWEKQGDPRFVDFARFVIMCFTRDPDGDLKGAQLSDAVRVVLRTAWLEHWSFDGLGSVIEIEMWQEPSRRADWATSVGPIQYADLPTGYWRYETNYTIKVRKPRS